LEIQRLGLRPAVEGPTVPAQKVRVRLSNLQIRGSELGTSEATNTSRSSERAHIDNFPAHRVPLSVSRNCAIRVV
jgi:hypothetical protein